MDHEKGALPVPGIKEYPYHLRLVINTTIGLYKQTH